MHQQQNKKKGQQLQMLLPFSNRSGNVIVSAAGLMMNYRQFSAFGI